MPMAQKPVEPHRSRLQSSQAVIAKVRGICLALPEANERISHGEPTWFAGKGKVFAMFADHHHGSEHLAVWLPQPLGVQELLIASDPARFFRPPYVGPSGWVGVVLDVSPDWAAVESLVRDAYRHVATRKLLARLEGPARPVPGAEASVRRGSGLGASPNTRKPSARKRAATPDASTPAARPKAGERASKARR